MANAFHPREAYWVTEMLEISMSKKNPLAGLGDDAQTIIFISVIMMQALAEKYLRAGNLCTSRLHFNNAACLTCLSLKQFPFSYHLSQIMTCTSAQMPTSAATIRLSTASRSRPTSSTAWAWTVRIGRVRHWRANDNRHNLTITNILAFQHPISSDRLRSVTSCTSSSARQLSSLSTAAKYVTSKLCV